MKIDCRKYFQSDTLKEVVEYDLDLPVLLENGVKPFPGPVKVRAEFSSFAGAVVLEGSLHIVMVMPCDRCFEETMQEKIVRYSHTLVRELNEEEDDESYILVPDEQLDLDQLLTEDILLDMPSKYLCSPDCKGLCPQCGANRNVSPCACERDVVDPRLEKLKALLEQE